MSYFKINGFDYSKYVNALRVTKSANYVAQINAGGNTVVDYINSKRSIEVGIIPLDKDSLQALLGAINGFSVTLSFLNPTTGTLENNVNCIIPESDIQYYTIQADKVLTNAFTLTFTEL